MFLVGTIILAPKIPFGDWLSYVFLGFFFGGFFYLTIWYSEFYRVWSRHQKKRKASAVALRGLQIGILGSPFVLFHIGYVAVFHSTTPYDYIIRAIGNTFLAIGFVIAGIGLLLDWRKLPSEVDLRAHQVLIRMKESGFEVDDRQLWIGIDCKLSSYGFFYPAGDESVILVSAWAVYDDDEGLDYTLIHEMCHAHLSQKKHPSHNRSIEKKAYESIGKGFPKSRTKIIHSASTYPAEVFTEDLAIKVLGSHTEMAKSIRLHFEGITKMRRPLALSRERRQWRNALQLIVNSYWAAQMERYQIPDLTGIVRIGNEKTLSWLPPGASRAFDYFRGTFLELPNTVTDEEFEKKLDDYLARFIALAEGRMNTFVLASELVSEQ